MFGKIITLDDTARGIKIEVWIPCTPKTSEAELKRRAIKQVKNYIRDKTK